ncbi:UNVERIFIED_ORG: hypothetical protein ABIC54_003570 [Burkholderia sp. 1263]
MDKSGRRFFRRHRDSPSHLDHAIGLHCRANWRSSARTGSGPNENAERKRRLNAQTEHGQPNQPYQVCKRSFRPMKPRPRCRDLGKAMCFHRSGRLSSVAATSGAGGATGAALARSARMPALLVSVAVCTGAAKHEADSVTMINSVEVFITRPPKLMRR